MRVNSPSRVSALIIHIVCDISLTFRARRLCSALCSTVICSLIFREIRPPPAPQEICRDDFLPSGNDQFDPVQTIPSILVRRSASTHTHTHLTGETNQLQSNAYPACVTVYQRRNNRIIRTVWLVRRYEATRGGSQKVDRQK